MIDPPWLPMILPEILKFRFSVHIVKDDWPPLTAKDLTRNLKFRFSLHMVKDDWPPPQKFLSLYLVSIWSKMIHPPWLPMIIPEILMLRFSLHMVTPWRNFKVYI